MPCPTRHDRGIQAASRIVELTMNWVLNIDRKLLIVNQTKEGQEKAIIQAVKDYGLDLIGMVPEDSEMEDFDLNGRPTVELGKDSNALVAAYEIFEKIF